MYADFCLLNARVLRAVKPAGLWWHAEQAHVHVNVQDVHRVFFRILYDKHIIVFCYGIHVCAMKCTVLYDSLKNSKDMKMR